MEKIIATNNPNIDIPKVVDEVEKLFNSIPWSSRHDMDNFSFKDGYNKSQETHPFSEDDLKMAIKDFHEMNMAYLTGKEDDNLDINEFIKKWKPKTIYYE